MESLPLPKPESTKQTFGFQTTRTPPSSNDLNQFEDKMLKIVQNIQFNNNSSGFQRKLSQDSKELRSNDKLLIAADKTTNFYRLNTQSYKQLLNKTITKSYKKAPNNYPNEIISKEKRLPQSLTYTTESIH